MTESKHPTRELAKLRRSFRRALRDQLSPRLAPHDFAAFCYAWLEQFDDAREHLRLHAEAQTGHRALRPEIAAAEHYLREVEAER